MDKSPIRITNSLKPLSIFNSPKKGIYFSRHKLLTWSTLATMLRLGILTTLFTSAMAIGCPSVCKCNDDTFVVECEGSKLGVLPIALNPAIQRLVLRNNKIKTVDEAFQFYKDLLYVDLSSNKFVTIPTDSFIYQEKLQELHLNRNKISSINNATFKGLKSLTILSLRENFLQELTMGIFSVLPKLEELNLGKNRISTIHPQAFDSLANLRILYLDDNMLNVVPTPSFPILGNLAELHIGLNSFTTLPDEAFKGLSLLAVLDVSQAGLVDISSEAFKGLNGLRSLNLAGNQLQQIPAAQISQLTRLEELSIGQNKFSVIQKNSFRGLRNLKKLDITGAPNLHTIEKGAFAENLNLETLILASNSQLETLEDGALVGLPNLRHLILRANQFRTFTESMVSWSELKTLEVTDNQIECNCELLWLGKLLAAKNFSSVQCTLPSQREISLRTLTSDDLGCSFSDPKQQAILISLSVGTVVVLAGLGMFLFRYRQRVRGALKDYKWNKRAISRKEHEYQKTFSEEDYIVRAAHLHNNIKPIPVTEL